MTVCIITFHYPPIVNGVGSAVHRIARNLVKAGIGVHIIAPGLGHPEVPITPIKEEGVLVHRTFPRLGHYHGDFLQLRTIADYIARLHSEIAFDVLHSIFLTPPGLLATLLSKQINVPSVVSIRGSDVELLRYSPELFGTIRWVLENASFVTSVNASLLEKAKQIANLQQECVISNAFDSDMFTEETLYEIARRRGFKSRLFVERLLREKSRGHLIIGTSGILRMAKGFPTLIEAFRRFRSDYSEAHLLVVGDFSNPEDKKAWLKRFKDMGLKRHISLTGRIPHYEVLTWLKAMDIFAFPSVYEGSPNALLEAMACGLPVVASKIGGVLEIVSDNKDGFLIPPGRPDLLADKFQILARNEKLRKEVSEAARLKVATQFAPEYETKTWIETYNQVCERHLRHRSC